MIKASPSERIKIAIRFMERMDLPPMVISEFCKNGTVCVFGLNIMADSSHCIFSRIMLFSELYFRIRKLQDEHNVTVFAVIRDYFEGFGNLYSFLCVSPYEEDWQYQFAAVGNNTYRCYAYVWNVNNDLFSEFGSVFIKSNPWGLRRVG